MEDDKYALYIPAIKPENAGRYTATAENDQGKATCSAQLRVSEPAELIVPIDLDDVDGSMEKSYKMSSVFKSTTTMQKTYSTNTSQVYGSNGNVEFHKIASEEEHAMKKVGDQPAQESHTSKKEEIHRTEPLASLVIKQSTKALEGSGQVLESAASQFQSSISTSKTTIAPKFTKPITSIVCNAGEKVQFVGHIEGYPEPSIKWYKNGSEMFRPDYPCTLEKGVATMTIPRAVEKDSARYTCTARNAAGTASSTADLVVKAMSIAPQFVKSLQAQVVKAGTRVEMTVEVTGVPDPDISWFKNGQPLSKAGFRRITKHDNTSTLVIMQAQPEDSGKYMVKAVNPAGEANSVVDFVVEQDQLPSQVKTTFSSKKVTIFEEKKQTVSRVSTLSPEPITLPEKIEKVEFTTISPSPTIEEKPKAVTEAPPTTPSKTEPKPTLPEYAAPSAKRFKPVKTTKPEKATIELSVQEEAPPKPMETTEAEMVPTKEEKVRVPPPPPPKPSPKSKQVFSESEDEFVRKELTFEPPKPKQTVTSSPSKIPIYSPPPLATPSKFVPISESPIPSSGCEDEPLQPTVWKPGGEQPVSATWRPVKPPSSTSTPVKALVPSHDGPPEQPMTMFQKSMHIKEETTTTTTIRKEILSPKLVTTFPELKGHSPPMPEPGPPPEFGYVDPKSVQRPVRTVVPPPPPTPTSMPKGGVPVYPGMPDAGCYTPPIGTSSHAPVFPKVATMADVRSVPLRPGTPPEMGFISPVSSSSTRVTEESTTTTVTTVKESTPPLQRGSPPQVGYVPLAPIVSPVLAEERRSTATQCEALPTVWKPNIDSSSAPVFVKPLQDKVVNEGEPVVFECIVQGDPTPNIHWYRDGQELPPLPDVKTRFQYNVCQLSIPKAIMLEHPCTISCVASNTSGSATTTAALRIKAQKCETSTKTQQRSVIVKSSGASSKSFMSARSVFENYSSKSAK